MRQVLCASTTAGAARSWKTSRRGGTSPRCRSRRRRTTTRLRSRDRSDATAPGRNGAEEYSPDLHCPPEEERATQKPVHDRRADALLVLGVALTGATPRALSRLTGEDVRLVGLPGDLEIYAELHVWDERRRRAWRAAVPRWFGLALLQLAGDHGHGPQGPVFGMFNRAGVKRPLTDAAIRSLVRRFASRHIGVGSISATLDVRTLRGLHLQWRIQAGSRVGRNGSLSCGA